MWLLLAFCTVSDRFLSNSRKTLRAFCPSLLSGLFLRGKDEKVMCILVASHVRINRRMQLCARILVEPNFSPRKCDSRYLFGQFDSLSFIRSIIVHELSTHHYGTLKYQMNLGSMPAKAISVVLIKQPNISSSVRKLQNFAESVGPL